MQNARRPCGCSACPNGAPLQYSVAVGTVSNNTCGDCASLGGTYVCEMTTPGCSWTGPDPCVCDYFGSSVGVTDNGDGTMTMAFAFGGLNPPLWRKTGARSREQSI